MKNVAQIIDDSKAGAGIQHRKKPYGPQGVQDFLRDVLAMANAPVIGPRHIIVGTAVAADGETVIQGVDDDDFYGDTPYIQLVEKYIEPSVPIEYEAALLRGAQVGVFEIGHCPERPYMIRSDYSETLRRGDAYIRVHDAPVKMGRNELQTLFQASFQSAVSAADLQVGFAGVGIEQDLRLKCCDLSQLPSTRAAARLEEMMKAQANSRSSGSTSMVARLAHARLYGPDDPYVSRSPEELMLEIDQVGFKYAAEDKKFLFESNAQAVQLSVMNRSRQAVTDASLLLALPRTEELRVADRLPSTSEAANDPAVYPAVTLKDNAVRVAQKIGDIAAGETVRVFTEPLRVCAGLGLAGGTVKVRYALQAANLRSPLKGTLRFVLSR